MMDNKEMEKKILGSEELENVSGGDGYYPQGYPQPGPVYPGQGGYPPQGPVYPGQEGYPPAPSPVRRPIGYKTRCTSCGRMGEVRIMPDGMRVGAAFCSCGGRMADVEPIFYA